MCKHGTHTDVILCKPKESGRFIVPVDSCIAKEIQCLNDAGIETLGCCCGHGTETPKALVSSSSADLAVGMGYAPYRYFFSDGVDSGYYEMTLKTQKEEITQ